MSLYPVEMDHTLLMRTHKEICLCICSSWLSCASLQTCDLQGTGSWTSVPKTDNYVEKNII